MDDNDFYEDDESIEERKAAWKAGERGVTQGPRDLNLRAKSVVDAVAARWDADREQPTLAADVDYQVLVFGQVPSDAERLDAVPSSAGLVPAGSRT